MPERPSTSAAPAGPPPAAPPVAASMVDPPTGPRGPLDVAALTAAASDLGLTLAVIDEIDSTNAELGRLARGLPGISGLLAAAPVTVIGAGAGAGAGDGAGAGAGDGAGAGAGAGDPPDRLVLVAERQTAGRGRMARSWQSPVGAGLTVSVLVRPAVPVRWLGWLPMVVGTSLVATLRAQAGVPAVLKWPNDVQVDGAKLAGILVEIAPSPTVAPAAVIGFGLNVTTGVDELPPRSTSLVLLGAGNLDRSALLGAILADLVGALGRWEARPAQAREEYRAVCATLGRAVRVELPDGATVLGTATDVDELGRLVVDGRAFSAADIVHLRSGPG